MASSIAVAKNSCPPLEGRVPEGRVRWTNGREVYTGAGTDKAVFEALPKQFVSPNSPRLARRLFERRSCPAFIRHEQASYRRASRLLRAVQDETNFLRRHSEKTVFTARRLGGDYGRPESTSSGAGAPPSPQGEGKMPSVR